jgi:hypothetical protein
MANALGKIVGSVTVLRYSVRLDDGTDVEAILPKSVLRKIGCLCAVTGWTGRDCKSARTTEAAPDHRRGECSLTKHCTGPWPRRSL